MRNIRFQVADIGADFIMMKLRTAIINQNSNPMALLRLIKVV